MEDYIYSSYIPSLCVPILLFSLSFFSLSPPISLLFFLSHPPLFIISLSSYILLYPRVLRCILSITTHYVPPKKPSK